MNNHLLVSKDRAEHYFSTQNGGIIMRHKQKDSIWSTAETVIPNAKGPFCVNYDSQQRVHLIYTDNQHNLSYGIKYNDQWKNHILTPLNSKFVIRKLQLDFIEEIPLLIASTEYRGENLLIRCTLTDNQPPHIVDKLASLHFYIFNKRLYYTNNKYDVGYVPLQGKNSDTFFRLYNNAENFSLYFTPYGIFTLYTRGSKLFINNKEVIYDSRMELPVLSISQNTIYVMWKSGGYVRYITSTNGEIWSSPMRYMTAGAEIRLFTLTENGCTRLLYGYNSPLYPHLFAKPDLSQF